MKSASVYFPNLDGIRAFACISVFIEHVFLYLNKRELQSGESWFHSHFIQGAGAMGVSLFFVLSGFLITYLLIREKEARKTIHIGFFYMKRILRIWPLFLLITITGFFILPLAMGRFDGQTVSDHLPWFLTFTNNFDRILTGFSGSGNDSLGVLWSVAVEEQFYLLWPLLILLCSKRLFPYLAVLVIAGSVMFRYYNCGHANVLTYHSFSVAGDLAIGGFTAYLAFHSAAFRNFFATQKAGFRIAMLLFLAILVFNHRLFLEANINAVLGRLLLSIAFAWIIADQCFAGRNRFALGRIPFLTQIGVISYGFYCYHMLVITGFQKLNVAAGWTGTSAAFFYTELVAAFAVTLGISWLSYRLLEKRFLKLRSRFDAMKTHEADDSK